MARRLIREHEDEIRAAWKSTSDVEVTNVSGTALMLLNTEEVFVDFKQFPWFKDASIGQLLKVERPHRIICIGQISMWIGS